MLLLWFYPPYPWVHRRVVGLKPPPKTWHFTFFDHQEGGISARLQDLVDYIITGDFRGLPSWWWMIYVLNAENIDHIFRSNQPIYSFYLVCHLGVFSREPLPSAKQQWCFQSSDHTFHQVFSSLANMASWNATEISRNDIVTSRNGFMAMNIRHVESMLSFFYEK